MLLFETVHQNPNGCLRVARIGNGRGRISLLYRENRGSVRWDFDLHDDVDPVSVTATPDNAQAVFDGLMHAIDPRREMPRPQLPVWALQS